MKKYINIILILLLLVNFGFAKTITGKGTVSALFLEIPYGASGSAMGDARIVSTSDVSSIYWNPAGLSYVDGVSAYFMYQPYVIDINTFNTTVAANIPMVGTVAIGVYGIDYGENDVTNMENQDGTGESFTAAEYALNFSYARKLANWFSFGMTGKYISSKIWHCTANALALDVGVITQTSFFSPTGDRENGLKIGMVITNYGSRMHYDGIDLAFPHDPNPDEGGEYQNAEGRYETKNWHIPVNFKVGVALTPIVSRFQKLTLEADYLTPNSNYEYMNVGGEYAMTISRYGQFFLRAGYKGLLMENNQFGLTYGGGMKLWMGKQYDVTFDYGIQSIGPLGEMNSFSMSLNF